VSGAVDMAERWMTGSEGAGGRERSGRRRSGWRGRVPTVFAGVLTTLALFCAASAVSLAFDVRSQPVRVTIDALLLPAPANLAYAALVAVLAAAVGRRKRVGYVFLLIYFAAQFVADVVLLSAFAALPPGDVQPPPPWWFAWLTAANLALTSGILALLWLSRREFYARVQRGSLRRALAVLAALLASFVVLGWALVEAFPGRLPSSGERLEYAAERVLGGALVFHFTRRGSQVPGWVSLLLGLFGAIAIFASLWVLFRSQRIKAAMHPDDERRVRDLLAADGERDSLGYFATRRDKAVVFSPSGKAAVTYRVVNGVTLASGDPLGDPEAWGPAIQAWLDQAVEYAWTPAVMGASEEGATAYARAGLRVLELGDEAVVHVPQFTVDGREMRPVRQAVNRVQRAGYRLRVRRHADIAPDEMVRIIELADRWRDTETERGFSMALGRLGDPADGQCVLVEAYDQDGAEAALLSFTPWGRTGLSLDLMRRDRQSDNGLVEFMVVGLVEAAPLLGVRRISLNFATFRSVFEEGARIGAGPVLRSWRRLLLFFSKWFQLESLYRSNVKYRPEWVPRYLCYEDVRDLAQVALASVVAEGFVVMPPSLPTLLRRGQPGGAPASSEAAPLPPTPLPPTPLPPTPPEPAPLQPGTLQPTTPVDTTLQPAPPVDTTLQPAPPVDTRPEQVRVRLSKVDKLRAAGIDPYPPVVTRTHDIAVVREAHPGLPPDTHTGQRVAVAGRVVLQRDHGTLCFATIRDWTGDLQVMLTADGVGRPALADWKSTVDLGDHVAVSGEVVTTRRGELSVLADRWELAAKCLHPLPDKHRGLADAEARVRARYLDLIINDEARAVLRARGAVLRALREGLVSRGYLEVETPILQPVHGGANARPFATHSNAYDIGLYLRIAPELYLKRLAVGGVSKVFELGRTFRNEGVDATHNPEFTMLEAYQAYGDYTTMRELTRELVLSAACAAHGKPIARRPDGAEVDLSGDWPVVSVHDAVGAALGEPVTPDTSVEQLRRLAGAARVPLNPAWDRGHVLLEMYERLVEAGTGAPTFYTDFPTEVSPLTRQHRTDPRLAERWDLVAFGTELGTAYTELVDPVEQRRRLTAQSLLAAGGDAEAMELDEDFLHALEYAMPPTGGLGLGVDRLMILLTGRTIRETLPFPLVRPVGAP
jgi:lysyl-tRNA synthetase class 2